MTLPMTGIAGYVNADGTSPKQAAGVQLAYSSSYQNGLYTISFGNRDNWFKQPPSVVVTPSLVSSNPSVGAEPVTIPIIWQSTPSLFVVAFFGLPQNGSPPLKSTGIPFIPSAFNFVAMEISTT